MLKLMLVHTFLLTLTLACDLVKKTHIEGERTLLGDGFHRKLHTILTIHTRQDISSCLIMMKETIPSGAYFDPYELNNVRSMGGPEFFIPEFIDVEAPEHHSLKLDAYFFGRVTQTADGILSFNISIPIHMRYHGSRSSAYEDLMETVKIPDPRLFLSCDEDLIGRKCTSYYQLQPCSPQQNHKCDFIELRIAKTDGDTEAYIPIGDSEQLETILFATTSVSFCTCGLLLLTLIKSKKS